MFEVCACMCAMLGSANKHKHNPYLRVLRCVVVVWSYPTTETLLLLRRNKCLYGLQNSFLTT